MADPCESIRARLRALEAELQDSQPVPGERHPPKPPPDRNALIRQIGRTRDELQACVERSSARRWTVTGDFFFGAFEVDAVVRRFMFEHDIRALGVAVARDGQISGRRAYTWAAPDYPITRPDTLFRVASLSKIFTCAAMDRLVTTGALTMDTRAFPFLGITPLPLIAVDPHINDITIAHLAQRQSGLRDDVERDIRNIARVFGIASRPSERQVLQYIFGTPLVALPGTGDNYSNPAFTVLTAIVEKASGKSFIEYLQHDVLAPLAITDVHVGSTIAPLRRTDEVATYDAAGTSPSHLDMADAATAPDAHGGMFALEHDPGSGGLIMSAGTIARFIGTHALWNIGSREMGGRYGKFAGTGSIAISRADGIDFAVTFNREIDYPAYDALVAKMQGIFDDSLIRSAITVEAALGAVARRVQRLTDTIEAVVQRFT